MTPDREAAKQFLQQSREARQTAFDEYWRRYELSGVTTGLTRTFGDFCAGYHAASAASAERIETLTDLLSRFIHRNCRWLDHRDDGDYHEAGEPCPVEEKLEMALGKDATTTTEAG